jgi:hypothetical protein
MHPYLQRHPYRAKLKHEGLSDHGAELRWNWEGSVWELIPNHPVDIHTYIHTSAYIHTYIHKFKNFQRLFLSIFKDFSKRTFESNQLSKNCECKQHFYPVISQITS